jgi:sulfatase maturation enzyme AslB (radical SAM superfamily)
MSDFEVLEPAIDPENKISFLLDWEITQKCNLDCDYCLGHDNTTKHPPLVDCLKTIDFMFSYADLYMKTKPRGIRYVVLNVYGGESLHHPDIVKILQTVRDRYQPFKDHWHLTVTTTTNAIISAKKLTQIIPLIDEFTVSYHTNNTAKQKNQFKENLLSIARAGRRQKCIVLMHSESELFADAQAMIKWCEKNHIKYLPKQLDHDVTNTQFNYQSQQVTWFSNLYNKKSFRATDTQIVNSSTELLDLSDVGRACCGGRSLCKDTNYKSRNFFVENKFPDWYCSVNHFFLHIKQINGEVYVNKDCKMNFDGTVSPIGYLKDTATILSTLSNQLNTNTLPIIQCKKYKCVCGLCAPKAKNLKTYNQIMEKYYR